MQSDGIIRVYPPVVEFHGVKYGPLYVIQVDNLSIISHHLSRSRMKPALRFNVSGEFTECGRESATHARDPTQN